MGSRRRWKKDIEEMKKSGKFSVRADKSRRIYKISRTDHKLILND